MGKMVKCKTGENDVKAIVQQRKLHSIAPYKRHIRQISFSASAFPTERIAGVMSRQTTFPDSGASARPQAQIPAATSSTASVGCGLIRDAAQFIFTREIHPAAFKVGYLLDKSFLNGYFI